MQNLKLDPSKKDYVFSNGSPIETDSVLEKCYYALTIPQGQWMYGETWQGSQLFTLENTKRNIALEQLFASYSKDAIKRQVIDLQGAATKVGVRNIAVTRTGSSNQIDVVPSQTPQTQFNFIGV